MAAVVALGACLVHLDHQQSIAELQRRQRARELESFQNVKSGESKVTVFGTPEILEMLAGDPECIRNLESIYFFICDLSDPRYKVLKKLTNVNDIGIYDCRGIATFLNAIGGMPSIKSIYLESIMIEDDMLNRFSSVPNLKRVHFERRLDVALIHLLKQNLPNATIEFVDNRGNTIVEQQGGP